MYYFIVNRVDLSTGVCAIKKHKLLLYMDNAGSVTVRFA